MKRTGIFCSILTFSLAALAGVSHAATIQLGVGNVDAGNTGIMQSGAFGTLEDLVGLSEGVSFTYDMIISGAVVRSGNASLGDNFGDLNAFGNNQSFTVQISINQERVTGGSVVFDGFTGFTVAAASNFEGMRINNQNYQVSAGDVRIANNVYQAFSSPLFGGANGGVFQASARANNSNGVILSGLSWEFTTTPGSVVVPEPSSSILVAIGGLTLIARRRR